MSIDSSVELTISSGTSIFAVPDFDDLSSGADANKTELIVEGQISAKGTSGSRISFRLAEGDSTIGGWYGIRLREGCVDTFRHIELHYAYKGLAASRTDLFIDSSTIRKCELDGIWAESSDVSIRECEIVYNGSRGIHLMKQSWGVVQDDSVSNNGIDGIRINSSGSQLQIEDNDILGGEGPPIGGMIRFAQNGVFCLTTDSMVEIKGNTIQSFTQGGIICNNSSPWIHDNTIRKSFPLSSMDGIRAYSNSDPKVDSCRVDSVGNGVFAYNGANPNLGDLSGDTANIRMNAFYEIDDYFVKNTTSDTILAENNYWNGYDDPDSIANTIDGDVDFDPWLDEDPFSVGLQLVKEDGLHSIPLNFNISQNRPNPFGEQTVIRYQVPKKVTVTLQIYDVTGRAVATLDRGEKEPGYYMIPWKGRDASGRRIPKGVYFCRLEAGDYRKTLRMVFLQ